MEGIALTAVDITSEDLKLELLKELPKINRSLEGFQDFACKCG
jgi:hypothetical protein